ncbi:DUF1365 domain-containing protein [Cupriavidus pauculus]|jgi:DUF1365 family protein|uniref:DUF1365 domain-containing protein n=1 Tax=Cupriavidus pauculus TaxID=82633 RepID=A0A5P2H289_9BURK|nr:DUF1365 domain-containing protein [Cupriavidus pauculus]QET02157.1 DUF1365 domain-containing protein [Cupriavidus pauculus]
MTPIAWLLASRVMHDRLRPVRNRFVYPVFCLRVNLDALPGLERWWFGVNRARIVSLRTADYGPRDGTDLATWMRARLREAGLREAGLPEDGEIWLQTFPRIFGYAFNPVSFWYCHDRDGALRALVAEVTNTFGGRHAYLVTAPNLGPIDESTVLATRKCLHVSPFNDVRGHYGFHLRETADTSFVGIDYFDDDGLLLRTSIAGWKRPLTGGAMFAALLRQPWVTLSVTARIHWQALRLWVRGVPFHGSEPPASRAAPPAHPEAAMAAMPPTAPLSAPASAAEPLSDLLPNDIRP